MNISLIRPVRELVSTTRDELRQRREATAAYRELQQQLASYQSPWEVDDLLGVISDEDGPEAQQIRDILLSNLRPRTDLSRVA